MTDGVCETAHLCTAHLIGASVNPLMGTLKPQSNGPLYSNAVIGTLAVDGWAVTFGTMRRGLGGHSPCRTTPNLVRSGEMSYPQRGDYILFTDVCPSLYFNNSV